MRCWNEAGFLKTKLTVNGDPKSFDPKKELVIYRVIQESLNNAVKHAEADQIQVEIQYTNNGLMIEVSDNGRVSTIKKCLAIKVSA